MVFKTVKIGLLLLAIFITISSQAYSQSDHIKKSNYAKWLEGRTRYLDQKGEIVNTALGPVQIVTKGHGPAILVLHGGFGGWDQGELVGSTLDKNGFKLIIPSRPGYLSTPIFTDPLLLQETTPSQQADLMVALLDALNIPQAVVLGFSAGAPVAYEFGLKFPERTTAVVLECIGANPNEDGLFYAILGAVLVSDTAEVDFITYLLNLSLKNDYYSTSLEILPDDTNLTGAALNRRIGYVVNHISQYDFLRNMLFATIPLSPRLLGTLNDFLGINYWTTTYAPPTLAQYSLPTLIIQAINDSNGFYPTAQQVHADLSTSELISVKESGHFIWLGPYTNKWERQLVSFLKAQTQ